MLRNLLKYIFLQEATSALIEKILIKENFIYLPKDIEQLLQGNQKDFRYGNIVLDRREDHIKQRRFLKIMLDGTPKTFDLFSRQVLMTDALHKDTKITPPTMAVVTESLNPPLPYAIFETLDSGEVFGFMSDSPAFYENFTEHEMQNLVTAMYSFHGYGAHIDPQVWKYTQDIHSDLAYYQKEFKKLLNEKIIHKNKEGKMVKEKVSALLATYTGMENIESRIMEILKDKWKYVTASKTFVPFLVHADMQIDNVYKHRDGTFELLDFEWVGKSDNPVTAIMYDYGNLRARAWSSPTFQMILDKTMLELGGKYSEDLNFVKAGLSLGTLRSSLLMSRYHLDFENTVNKDRRSEEEYQSMYPKTIASLVNVIKI